MADVRLGTRGKVSKGKGVCAVIEHKSGYFKGILMKQRENTSYSLLRLIVS